MMYYLLMYNLLRNKKHVYPSKSLYFILYNNKFTLDKFIQHITQSEIINTHKHSSMKTYLG